MNDQEMRKRLDNLDLRLSEEKYELLLTLVKVAHVDGTILGFKQSIEVLEKAK